MVTERPIHIPPTRPKWPQENLTAYVYAELTAILYPLILSTTRINVHRLPPKPHTKNTTYLCEIPGNTTAPSYDYHRKTNQGPLTASV